VKPNEPGRHDLRFAQFTGGTHMESRADQYRQLARDCLRLANMVPSGPPRDTLIDMAREWGHLADEQDHASDLRKKK
jgi:hypothetical protein